MANDSLSNSVIDDPEQCLALLRAEPATWTREEIYEFDAQVHADRDGVTRRCALAVLTQPGATLLDAMRKDASAVAFAAIGFARDSRGYARDHGAS